MRSVSRLPAALLCVFVSAAVFAEDSQPNADESETGGCSPAERRAGCKDEAAHSSGSASKSDYIPGTEAERFGQLWFAYRQYKGVHAGIFDRCQERGVETAKARAANAKFDEQVDAKFPILEARLKEAIVANGHPDPAANIRNLEEILAANIKLAVDEVFVKFEASKIENVCEVAVLELGSLESSFRFTDFYERMMAL